jgi:hypothetical protein
MLSERGIQEEWVWRAIRTPEEGPKPGDDRNMHYMMPIVEDQGRVLHVVVNPEVEPNRIVTAFFDRRRKSK